MWEDSPLEEELFPRHVPQIAVKPAIFAHLKAQRKAPIYTLKMSIPQLEVIYVANPIFFAANWFPGSVVYDGKKFNAQPYFKVFGFAGLYLLQYTSVYYSDPSQTPSSLRTGYASLDCLTGLPVLFTSLAPSANSNMYMLDDFGLMVTSTINGTIAINGTNRYNGYSNNPDSRIAGIGNFLANKYGLTSSGVFAINSNFTQNSVTIAGTVYIVSTQFLVMPSSGQQYTLILFAPRSDFYSKADNALHNAIMVSLIIVAVGIILVGGMAHLGSLPLKKLAVSMEKLTKFDFSVLESGSLDSTSFVKELNRVESTFLLMVKAFAQQIKKNKEMTVGFDTV
ncbi:hypothetical protein HK100_007928, partial [Physocladia obscura]